MPIYEFYCRACHTVFSFFSARVDTTRRPDCPRCGRGGLERRPSVFSSPRGDDSGDGPAPGIDEERLERAFTSMADEIEALGERAEDPATVASLLRRLGDASGLDPGPKLEEMLARVEAGEDPETIERELGEGDDESLDDLFRARRQRGRDRRPPRVDDTLYSL